MWSQSLWNRAVSYDLNYPTAKKGGKKVSIPLEQGSVLRRCRPLVCNCIWGVSIPLEQGSVLRPIAFINSIKKQSLNPFGTGQCLTTHSVLLLSSQINSLNPFGTGQCLTTTASQLMDISDLCLNPFGTGQCLTTENWVKDKTMSKSQSLWNRAVSYDLQDSSEYNSDM